MTLLSPAFNRALWTPGAVVFALMFALDSLARASLGTVIPLEALHLLGNPRDVSIFFAVAGCLSIAGSLFIPVLVRRYRPRWVYTLGAALLCVIPVLLATSTVVGLAAGTLLRLFAAACLLNALNLYIMAYIHKRDLARSEPLRTFFSATAWMVGPTLGVYLFDEVSPYAAYALSSVSAVLLLFYFWKLRLEYGPALPADQPRRSNPLQNIRRFLAQPRLRLAWVLNFGRETWWVMFFIYAPVYMVTSGYKPVYGALVVSCATAFLYTTPITAAFARRIGLRPFIIAGMSGMALATAGTAVLIDTPLFAAASLLLAGFAATCVDSVIVVLFLRAVRARERPEMTMVFVLYRDAAGLLPPAVFALLLSFLPLASVFSATSLLLVGCVWLARWIPRTL